MAVVEPAVRLLRATFREAVERGVIAVNPIPAREFRLHGPAKTVIDDSPPPYLERHEQLALLACDAVSMELRVVLATALYSGARRSELQALEWGDLDLDGDQPRWRLSRGLHGTTKNRRVRNFVLSRCFSIRTSSGRMAVRLSLLLPSHENTETTKLATATTRARTSGSTELSTQSGTIGM